MKVQIRMRMPLRVAPVVLKPGSRLARVGCMTLVMALAGCSDGGSGTAPTAAASAAGLVRGYVITNFAIANLPSGPDVCPQGFALTERDLFLAGLSPAQRAKDARENPDWIRRVSVDRDRPNQCSQPTAYDNPGHITLDDRAVAEGFDLDGGAANTGLRTCSHREFISSDGAQGIDNQLWRVFGCVKGYQPGSTIDEYAVANIKSGGRTILIEISGIDDERNDAEVQLGIYSSSDPVPLDGVGNIAANGSLQVGANKHFHTRVAGKLKDGVLTAGPIDELRLEYNGQFLKSEYQFRHAKVRLEFAADGTVEGIIGGYWDIEGFYDAHARQATRAGALTIGYTCPGLYGALHDQADGFPDADTGECTAISAAFRLRGVPAFVIHPDLADVAATPSSAAGDSQ